MFHHKGALRIHMRNCKAMRMKCNTCVKTFRSKQGFYGHQSRGRCWRGAAEGEDNSGRGAVLSLLPTPTLWNNKIDSSWQPTVEIEAIESLRQAPGPSSVQKDQLLDISQAYLNLRGWRVIANEKKYMTWNKVYISPGPHGVGYGTKKAAVRCGYVGSLMRNVMQRSKSCPVYASLRTRGARCVEHTVMKREDAQWKGVQLPGDFLEATQLIVAALDKSSFNVDTRAIKHTMEMPDGGLRISLGLSAAYNRPRRHRQNAGVTQFQISAETKGRPELSRLTASLIHLGLKKLKKLGAFVFTAIQINKNSVVRPHVDFSHGDAYVLTLGRFTGGGIWLQGQSNFYDARQGLLFDSRRYHATEPYAGTRYSLVAYTQRRLPLSNVKRTWSMLAHLRDELRFRVPSLNSIQNATVLGESPAPTKLTKLNKEAAELEYDDALRGRSEKKVDKDEATKYPLALPG